MRCLADQDADIEQWLKDEVVPTVKAHDQSKAIPIREVRRRITAHMDSRDTEACLPE